jgi:hypothetical protein
VITTRSGAVIRQLRLTEREIMRSHCDGIACQWNPAFINRCDTGLSLSRLARQTARLLVLLAALSCVALAQLPGDPAPAGKPPRKGSALVYNYYSSNFPATTEDTIIKLTNHHETASAYVHLFFIDGGNCSPADLFYCLAPEETISFNTSVIDPNIRGYIVAFSTDINGLPNNFNFLSGRAKVKLASGHQADIDALAIEALASAPAPPPDISGLTTVSFDGIHYDRVPRVLELDPVYSVADGVSTILAVNRLGGNLAISVPSIGAFQGVLTNNDTGNQYNFSGSAFCRINQTLSDAFPLISPVFSLALPAEQEGNLKIWAVADNAISGAALIRNPDKKAKKFNSGDNLRAVTVTTASFVVPVFPPTC